MDRANDARVTRSSGMSQAGNQRLVGPFGEATEFSVVNPGHDAWMATWTGIRGVGIVCAIETGRPVAVVVEPGRRTPLGGFQRDAGRRRYILKRAVAPAMAKTALLALAGRFASRRLVSKGRSSLPSGSQSSNTPPALRLPCRASAPSSGESAPRNRSVRSGPRTRTYGYVQATLNLRAGAPCGSGAERSSGPRGEPYGLSVGFGHVLIPSGR
jgi:hypothetical protein